MALFAKLAAAIFRDYSTDGVPASGKHAPAKDDIRVWGKELEDYIAVAYDSANSLLGGSRYDIGAWVPGRPASSEEILDWLFTINVSIPASFAQSRAKAGTAATASTVISVQKNNVEFGTITFAIGGTDGVFSAISQTDFAPGDELTLMAPASRDLTIADLVITITGTR